MNHFSTAWSPDGQWIVFASRRESEELDLHLISPDGSERRRLTTTDAESEWFPTWSPDSKWIAFERSAPGGNIDIWVIAASGGEAMRLTEHEALDGRPSWSPDGRQIAFTSLRGGGWDIWTIYVEVVDE